MTVYVGQGDPEQSMRLLWKAAGGVRAADAADATARPGPKAELSAEQIVGTAIELADAGGIDGVSMRAIAEKLSKTPMALYTHVPSKAVLIDLMWDQVLGELPIGAGAADGWRPALEAWARAGREFFLRHPWTLDISGARAGLGPNETRNQEAAAAILAGQGFSPEQVMWAAWTVHAFVQHNARSVAEARRAGAETGEDESSWWFARSGMLEELVPDYAERFPVLSQLSAQGAFDGAAGEGSYLENEANSVFEFGLGVLLDGLQAQLDQRPRT